MKLRKKNQGKAEPLQELTREAGVLTFLREQQELYKKSSGKKGMDLWSRLPEPVGNVQINDYSVWLNNINLPPEKKQKLDEMVSSERGSTYGYCFRTKCHELYHRYLHERRGEPGLSRENSLKALVYAAHDVGVLFHNGFSVSNSLPAFHAQAHADTRSYKPLNQLDDYGSQGGMRHWNGLPTDFPNYSPWPVILRDFTEIKMHQEMDSPFYNKNMNQPYILNATALNELARNALAFELLLARTLTEEFNSRAPAIFSALQG